MEPIISTNTDDIELASSHPKSSTTSALKLHISTALGEFIGTTVFLFLAEGAAKTAKLGRSVAETDTKAPLDSTTVLVIATSFGLSLIISAWAFFRITGGLFNPAITLALWFVGVITTVRAIFLAIVQILGGITAAALVLALTPLGGNTNGVDTVNNTLTDVTIAQGFFLEMLGTSILIFTVLLLAVEKHRATFMAPVGIGLTLFSINLFLVPWTGCAVNPARAFGPAVISGHFPNYHWIYWIAPLCGTLFAVFYYELLKVLEYNNAVLAIDGEKQISIIQPAYIRIYRRFFG